MSQQNQAKKPKRRKTMTKFIELTYVGDKRKFFVNICEIERVSDDVCHVPGDDGCELLMRNGKTIGVAETYEEVKGKIIQACIEEEERICITHTEDGEFLRKGNKIYRRTTL